MHLIGPDQLLKIKPICHTFCELHRVVHVLSWKLFGFIHASQLNPQQGTVSNRAAKLPSVLAPKKQKNKHQN